MSQSILREFSKMLPNQQLELLKQLENNIGGETKILSYIDKEKKNVCYHCQSSTIIKMGFYAGKQRYKCKECQKTFGDFTGTSVYCIKKKHLWMSFIKLMLDSKSIRYTAKQLGLSPRTVLDWRHKLLEAFAETFQKKFKGIVETDDIYLPFNQKGRKRGFLGVRKEKKKRGISSQKVAIMVWADRYKTLGMQTVKLGRINCADLQRTTNIKRLNSDNIICSDRHRSIEAFVKKLNIKHQQFKAGIKEYVKAGIYHVQKVNSLTSHFKKWLNSNFINVATKYLQNYLNWFQMLQIFKDDNTFNSFLNYSLKDNNTFYRFKQLEINYQTFLKY